LTISLNHFQRITSSRTTETNPDDANAAETRSATSSDPVG